MLKGARGSPQNIQQLQKIIEVDARVILNSASIAVLKNSVKTLNKRKDEQPASRFSSQPPPGDDGSSIAVARQTHFNNSLWLGQLLTMIFEGELHKYVQFITMFKNSFDETINDSVTLYKILMRHVKGSAKTAIEPCIFSASSTNRYEEAMAILKERYGQKNGVLGPTVSNYWMVRP